MKKISLTAQIGILLGNQADFVNTYIKPLGIIFLNLLKFIVVLLVLFSIGTPGIPGGSLALMAMVFASAGIPVECVAVAAGIDRIIDMGRTVMSVTGDASCAIVMQRIVGKKL